MNKKIAIFHNFLDNIGGAEIVTLTLARELNADIYTTNINAEKIKKMGFKNQLPKIHSIGKIPINAPFKQQSALIKFKKLNLNKKNKKYDFFIIAGDWAMSGAVNNKPNLWYVHSPIREIWDSYEYVKSLIPLPLRPIYTLWTKYNRYLNKKHIRHVNKIICNSNNTKQRVKKYLKRDAIIINPPIEIQKYKSNQNKDYWLSVNRLFHNKQISMQLKAFSKLPNEKLIIVGSYEKSKHFQKYAKYIKSIKPKNVEILSWVNDKKLKELYSNCKGFITTARDEDFGMTAIEAMASGKPVITPNEGGYKETIINNKTGILIDNINSIKLIQEIKNINQKLEKNPKRFIKPCQKQAKKYDTKIFINKIKSQIKNTQNKKKKIIIFKNNTTGLNARLTRFLNLCYVAEKKGWIPIPIWKGSNFWKEKGKNIWPLLFEEVGYNKKDLLKNLEKINLKEYHIKNKKNNLPKVRYSIYCPKLNEKIPSINPQNPELFNKLIHKYIIPTKKIKNKIKKYYQLNFKNKKILGVHMRGPGHTHGRTPTLDKLIKIENKHYEQYFKLIDKKIKKYNKIFLATDADIVRKKFKKRYGKKVFWINHNLSKKGEQHARKNAEKKHPSIKKLFRNCLIDIYLLSKCNHFIYGNSNVSLIVLCLAPNISKENIYDKIYQEIKSNQEIK